MPLITFLNPSQYKVVIPATIASVRRSADDFEANIISRILPLISISS